jgi:hypothetical protein
MRRTFAQAKKAAVASQLGADAYAKLYDDLYEKLLDMVGPIPEHMGDLMEN